MGVLHLFDSSQRARFCQFVLLFIREHAFIDGQIILGLVQTGKCLEFHLAVRTLHAHEAGLAQILPLSVYLLADGQCGGSDPSFEKFSHAMVVEQCLLVKAEGIQIFPRQLVFIKLIPPGQFGDTSLVVEFAVLHHLLAVRSGVFPFPDLDDRVQHFVQHDERNKEKTETCGVLVLVLEIREEQFQRCGTIQFEETAAVLLIRRHDLDAAVLLVHSGDDGGPVRSLVKDCHYMLVLTLLLLLLLFLSHKINSLSDTIIINTGQTLARRCECRTLNNRMIYLRSQWEWMAEIGGK